MALTHTFAVNVRNLIAYLQQRVRLVEVRAALALLDGCHVSAEPRHDVVSTLGREAAAPEGALCVEGGDVRPPVPGSAGCSQGLEQAQLPEGKIVRN